MKGLSGAALLVGMMLAVSACGGGYQANASHNPGPPQGSVVSAGTVSSSALILSVSTYPRLDGRVRCTATVPSSVQAGSALGLTFTVRNVSDRPVKMRLANASWLVVKAADGKTYDTRVLLRNQIGGPFIAPTPIPPGATRTLFSI